MLVSNVLVTQIVMNGSQMMALVTAKEVEEGECLISECAPAILDRPTMYTIEHSNGTHLDIASDMRYTNHSFSPSAVVKFHPEDPSRVTMIAARSLAAGEPVTFDYSTTET